MQHYPQQWALSCTKSVQQRKVLVAGVRITRASESWTCTRNMHTRSKLRSREGPDESMTGDGGLNPRRKKTVTSSRDSNCWLNLDFGG